MLRLSGQRRRLLPVARHIEMPAPTWPGRQPYEALLFLQTRQERFW